MDRSLKIGILFMQLGLIIADAGSNCGFTPTPDSQKISITIGFPQSMCSKSAVAINETALKDLSKCGFKPTPASETVTITIPERSCTTKPPKPKGHRAGEKGGAEDTVDKIGVSASGGAPAAGGSASGTSNGNPTAAAPLPGTVTPIDRSYWRKRLITYIYAILQQKHTANA